MVPQEPFQLVWGVTGVETRVILQSNLLNPIENLGGRFQKDVIFGSFTINLQEIATLDVCSTEQLLQRNYLYITGPGRRIAQFKTVLCFVAVRRNEHPSAFDPTGKLEHGNGLSIPCRVPASEIRHPRGRLDRNYSAPSACSGPKAKETYICSNVDDRSSGTDLDARLRINFLDPDLPPQQFEVEVSRNKERNSLVSAKICRGRFLIRHLLFVTSGVDWEIEPRLRPPPLANPEEQSLVPSRVVRIARTRGLALLFPVMAPVACSWRGR